MPVDRTRYTITLEPPEFRKIHLNYAHLPLGMAHNRDALLKESGCSAGLHSIRWYCVFEEARCEVLGEDRSKNGSGKQQHEDHIEQPAIDQALTGRVSSI